MWFSSTIAFSSILHIVTFKIFIEILFFNCIVFWAAFLSLLIYWIMVICMNTNGLAPYFNSQIQNTVFKMFSNLKFWLAIIGIPILALLPDISIKYIRQVFWPSPTDKVILKMMQKEKFSRKRKWKLALSKKSRNKILDESKTS